MLIEKYIQRFNQVASSVIASMYNNSIGAIRNRKNKNDVYYIIEGGNWSIDHDGYYITKNIRHFSSITTTTINGIRNSIVHFGSINAFIKNGRLRLPHKSNKIVVTWFHINPGDERVKLIPEAVKYVDLWHTSCRITGNKLIRYGVPKEKLEVIPLGVNLDLFYKPRKHQKDTVRSKLGIPQNKIVIGSFQKDGNGWGKGLDPKLIKGPDIFCDVVEQLSKRYSLFIMLTGPARGYVKRRLENANIPYLHQFLSYPDEVAEYYRAIDIYIVTSREEGGPKSILESLASAVPLVTTKIGMGPDIIQDGISGFLCEVEDVDGIVEKSIRIIEDVELRDKMAKKGLDIVKKYDWANIAMQYEQLLYRPLL